jgi:membrane fusion protein (multidrug efflux system)
MLTLRSLTLGATLAALPLFAQAPVEAVVTSPRRGDIHRFVTLPGTLRANQQVTLHAKVAGHVKAIAVDKGDAVQAGQLLAELEMPEWVAERSRHEAEVRLADSEHARVRAARAKAPDLITPQAVEAAESRLATARAAAAQNAAMLGFGRITAPFAGVVTARFVDAGAFVPAATAGGSATSAAVVTVMDYSVVRARVAVPEIEAARVRVGQPVVVAVEALPGRSFPGKVSRHVGALDESTRSLVVEADLANADGALRPGMYASIRVGVELHTGALLVPSAAVVREKALAFVFTLAEGKAVRVPVKAGFNDGTSTEILEGLAENARVLVPGKTALVAGQPVKAVEAK